MSTCGAGHDHVEHDHEELPKLLRKGVKTVPTATPSTMAGIEAEKMAET